MHKSSHALAVLLFVVTTGCGVNEPLWPQPEDDGAYWHAGRPPRTPEWGLARREFVPIRLPEARHALADWDHRPEPRVVINLQQGGEVTFKGNEYRFDPAGVDLELALGALRDGLAHHLRDPRHREPDGASRIPVLFHADRSARWSWIGMVMGLLPEPDIGVDQVQIAVQQWTWGTRDRRIDGHLVTGGGLPAIVVVLEQDRPGSPVQMAFGDARFRFPEDPGFGAGRIEVRQRFVDSANDVWREAEAQLGDLLAGAPDVALDVAPSVELGYVVTTIDLLLDHGVGDVAFAREGLRVRFADMPITRPDPDYERAVDAMTLLWVLLGVLLAIGVPLLGFLGRRRRKKMVSGTNVDTW